MNSKEFENVLRLPASKRYEYFIKKVSDSEEVWGLYGNGWATAQDNDGSIVIPFWPKKEFAQFCAKGSWEEYLPKSIGLEDFLDKWLPGMLKDNYKPAIFYTDNDQGIVVETDRLKNDIEEELENY